MTLTSRRLAHWLLILALLPTLIRQQPAGAAGAAIYVVPGGAGERTGADWANAMDLRTALASAAASRRVTRWSRAAPPARAISPSIRCARISTAPTTSAARSTTTCG